MLFPSVWRRISLMCVDKAQVVEHVGIVGGGLMGSGIAMAFVNRGFTVHCLEVSQDRADACLQLVRKQYEKSVLQGKLKSEDAEERLSRFSVTTEMTDLASCDLVIRQFLKNGFEA